MSFLGALAVSLLGWPLMTACGLALIVVLVLTRPLPWRSGFVLAIGTALLLTVPFEGWGHRGWSWISLKQHQADYESIIGRADRLPDCGTWKGQTYVVERGRPGRVYFPRAYGIPDGEGGVVHDPTGEVTRSDSMLSEGRVQSCIQIDGPWYRCWFD